MAKVVTAGMNTMVMPEITPGMDWGTTTRVTTRSGFAPRSSAASMMPPSTFLSAVYTGSTMKGRKLYTMPSSTAPSVPMNCTLGRPSFSNSVFSRPLFSRMVIMA